MWPSVCGVVVGVSCGVVVGTSWVAPPAGVSWYQADGVVPECAPAEAASPVLCGIPPWMPWDTGAPPVYVPPPPVECGTPPWMPSPVAWALVEAPWLAVAAGVDCGMPPWMPSDGACATGAWVPLFAGCPAPVWDVPSPV